MSSEMLPQTVQQVTSHIIVQNLCKQKLHQTQQLPTVLARIKRPAVVTATEKKIYFCYTFEFVLNNTAT